MGLLAKLFGALPRKEMEGIHLDYTRQFWVVSGKTDFPSLLPALHGLLPKDSVLYFEGGSPEDELLDFLTENGIPERIHVAAGMWPRPRVFHVPATPELTGPLVELMRSRAYLELAIHFHVYNGESVLLEWHDVFDQEMLLSGLLPEASVKAFAGRVGMAYKESEPQAKNYW